jgi:hypothetical protein
MSNDDELVALFKRAAEIASAVPEEMREAAFHRALDALQTGVTPAGPGRGGEGRERTPGARKQTKGHEEPRSTVDPVPALLSLERSRAEDVDNEDGALGKALALLRVAERELSIERLSAPQIAQILTEKFRWRVTRQSVMQALERSGRFVDRRKEGAAMTYRLMQPGEDWLNTDSDTRKARASTGRSRAGRGSPAKKPRTDPGTSRPGPAKAARPVGTATKKSRPGKTGPKGAVEALISSGYFSTPRTLADLQQTLQHERALRYKPTDLSPGMTRLIREGRLARAKNADGQYEYIAANA